MWTCTAKSTRSFRSPKRAWAGLFPLPTAAILRYGRPAAVQTHGCWKDFETPLQGKSLPHWGFGDADIFVSGAVIKKKAVFFLHHSFNKDHVRNLADFFPFIFGEENRFFRAVEEFAGIAAVEDGYAGAIDEIVVGAVVDQHDALLREGWRGPRLDYAGVKFSGTARENWSFDRFRPVDQIGRVREAHLVSLVGGSAEPVHPIFAINFFGNDSAGFGPTFVPVSLVGGENDAFAVPVDEVAGCGEAKLGVFFIVAGVGEVVGVAELLEPRVFNAAIFFVVGFGREDGIGAPREVKAVGAFGVAEARGAEGVLRAIEHDEFIAMKYDGRIEGAGGFPGVGLRGEDGVACGASPGAEREIGDWRGDGQGGGEKNY